MKCASTFFGRFSFHGDMLAQDAYSQNKACNALFFLCECLGPRCLHSLRNLKHLKLLKDTEWLRFSFLETDKFTFFGQFQNNSNEIQNDKRNLSNILRAMCLHAMLFGLQIQKCAFNENENLMCLTFLKVLYLLV